MRSNIHLSPARLRSSNCRLSQRLWREDSTLFSVNKVTIWEKSSVQTLNYWRHEDIEFLRYLMILKPCAQPIYVEDSNIFVDRENLQSHPKHSQSHENMKISSSTFSPLNEITASAKRVIVIKNCWRLTNDGAMKDEKDSYINMIMRDGDCNDDRICQMSLFTLIPPHASSCNILIYF